MSEPNRGWRLSELRLSVEDREQVAQTVSELIAIHVYRELQRVNASKVSEAGCAIIGNCSGGSGCDIIGNCSSSSKEDLL